ncbi:unnamed protein product, partial [Mycena citricolor]
ESTVRPLVPASFGTDIQDYQHRFREALVAGGSGQAVINASRLPVTESVHIFQIPLLSLKELLGSGSDEEGSVARYFVCDFAEAKLGSLTTDLTNRLGVGSFKDAYLGWLTLNRMSDSGLGFVANQKVAVKRMFTNKGLVRRGTLTRLQPRDEYTEIMREANLLLWSYGLFNAALSYVTHRVRNFAAEIPSDLRIPTLRFVDAALALVHKPVAGGSVVSATTLAKSYLLEEYISTLPGEKFKKFVHNGEAVPALAPQDPDFYIAEFLCFTQHFQYAKSGGLVILSDLQGSSTLLTDAQIMTSSTLTDEDVFGGGNIPAIFDRFEDEHKCNVYCRAFGMLPFQVYDEDAKI